MRDGEGKPIKRFLVEALIGGRESGREEREIDEASGGGQMNERRSEDMTKDSLSSFTPFLSLSL